jgi:hypothetical protein
MNRFDRLTIGDGCPRHADRRIIFKADHGIVECAPNGMPLEYARVVKTVQVHDLAKYADDPESAADLELALEQAGVLR